MPDLGNLLNMASPVITGCSNNKTGPNEESELTTPSICESGRPECGNGPCKCDWGPRLRFPISAKSDNPSRRSRKSSAKNLDDYVRDWVAKKIELGVPENKCILPFLVGAAKLAECRLCQKVIYPGEEVLCSIRDCKRAYHLKCTEGKLAANSSREFKCPQHACFLCKQKHRLCRCARCHLAWHDKCAAFPEHVVRLNDQPGKAICWRHFTDWPPEKVTLLLPSSERLVERTDLSLLNKQHEVPTNEIEEVFHRLPIPNVEKEFRIGQIRKEISTNKLEPPPYVHIRRNLYLVKKKHNDTDCDSGCTNCTSNICSDDCVCRVQCVSCSKLCRCSDACTNRPFRKDKKIKVVPTELCGWGVEAAEYIAKGDFIIEYIGEVISDVECTARFWDMKNLGHTNFYLCEVRKNFTIDATFRGNSSRFLNHSCDPNCILEKWQVEGEIRLGLFAIRSIEVGEPLTYDYRFVQFGEEVKCKCGASNCQGYLGTKKKIPKEKIDDWGTKRRRTRSASRANR